MELRCGAYVLCKSLKISVSDFELLILARPSKLGNGWEGFSLSLLYFSLFSYFQSFEDNKIGQEKSNSSNLDESTPSYFEKQPFRGVLRKKCSEIMQQIYRRTPMSNCDFNKVTLFGMGVLLYICCIFSEHLYRRAPLGGCFFTQNLLDSKISFFYFFIYGLIFKLQFTLWQLIQSILESYFVVRSPLGSPISSGSSSCVGLKVAT